VALIRLLHVTEDHSAANTGITAAVNTYCRQLLPQLVVGEQVGICAVAGPAPTTPGPVPVTEVPPARWAAAWRWSPELRRVLERHVTVAGVNLLHAHGIWMGPQVTAARLAARHSLPLVLSNHGALTDWALAQPGRLGAFKKQVYLTLVAKPVLSAAVLHAITQEEREALHRLFPRQRIELIPNSIDLDEMLAPPVAAEPADDYLLFIGRLHPKKGVDLLIDAFLAARLPRRLRLLVAGPEQDLGYGRALAELARNAEPADRVQFLGPVWGDARFALMRNARAVIVPSFSEVIGLVNLEAAACSTPTVTTPGTGLLDWSAHGGVLVAPERSALAVALEQVGAWSAEERIERGDAMRRLVETRYSTAATAPLWYQLYRELR
jgi:glycosyltransferase involved in cell wall biosynthesis